MGKPGCNSTPSALVWMALLPRCLLAWMPPFAIGRHPHFSSSSVASPFGLPYSNDGPDFASWCQKQIRATFPQVEVACRPLLGLRIVGYQARNQGCIVELHCQGQNSNHLFRLHRWIWDNVFDIETRLVQDFPLEEKDEDNWMYVGQDEAMEKAVNGIIQGVYLGIWSLDYLVNDLEHEYGVESNWESCLHGACFLFDLGDRGCLKVDADTEGTHVSFQQQCSGPHLLGKRTKSLLRICSIDN